MTKNRVVTFFIAGSILAVALALVPVAAMPKTITIRHDTGGRLIDYVIRMKLYKATGRKVRFAGECYSACTIYLALPRRQLCITPNASFWFHKPYGASPAINNAAERSLMGIYPYWTRRWIQKRGGLSRRWAVMEYETARRHLNVCRI